VHNVEPNSNALKNSFPRTRLRVNIICLATLFMALSCSTQPQHNETEATKEFSRGEEIVHRSIESHGGLAAWQNLQSISYSKTIILTDSSGIEESRVTQYHNYQLKPELAGSISWISGNDSISIVYKNEAASRFVNGVEETVLASKGVAKASFFSAYYVLFQPFKLLDEGTELTFIGEDEVENGLKVNVVQPVYEGAKPGDDRWWYYFNKETNQLAANMVNHPPTYSYIVNLAYDSSTAIIFNAHRKSYFVDSLRNVQYLRAEYFYTDYILNQIE